jgi:hypothetical protein
MSLLASRHHKNIVMAQATGRSAPSDLPTTLINALRHRMPVIKRLYKRTDLQVGKNTKLQAPKELRVLYRDICSLKYFYWMMHEWFIDNGWTAGSRLDQDFPEVQCTLREQPIGNELWFRWRFTKESPNGALYRWHIDLDAHVLGAKQVETIINGQKVKVDSAEIEVWINSLCLMMTAKWENNALMKSFKDVLIKTIYRKAIDREEEQFEKVVWECEEMVKTYFKMPTYLPERQGNEFYQKADMT